MKHALLCGTVYGSNYLPVLTDPKTNVRLGGILSRGSERSRQFAQSANVPHHVSLDELADGQVDIVIVAVSGIAGVELAVESLGRGFHVLAEHPWEPEHIERALEAAKEAGCCFHVNSHWGDLENSQQFIEGCRVASQHGAPVFASMMTNPRTFYSGLDLLRRVVGSLNPATFSRLTSPSDSAATAGEVPPFVVIQGTTGGTLVTLQNQTFTSHVDDGTSALVNHHLVVGFRHGHLTLAETTGPATWVPDLTRMASMGVAGQSQAASTPLPPEHSPTVGEFLQGHRVEANRLALDRLLKHAAEGMCPNEQSDEHLLEVSRAWRELGDMAGPINYVANS